MLNVNEFLKLKAAAPSCTELETIVLNWLGKMIGIHGHSN